MKKINSILIASLFLLSLVACNSNKNAMDSAIEVKGCFLLEPAKDVDLSKEKIDSVQKYLFVVYDVVNPTKSNIEVRDFTDGVTIKLGENKYEQLLPDYEHQALKGLVNNCGYTSSYNLDTLWSGKTEPIRCIAAFAVNKNDFTENAQATINFDLATEFATTKTISISDIQTIGYFDGVYAVEGDRKDDYQIARSIIRRLEAANAALETCIIALNNKDETGVKYSTAYLSAFFSEEPSWGISTCGVNDGFVVSDSLPTFKVDAVTRIYPEVQEQLKKMISNIDTFIDNVESKDYDTANKTAINLRSDFKYFKEYFNLESLF